MPKPLKKPEFLAPFARLFTSESHDVFASLVFQSSDSFGDESEPALASPVSWSAEAVEVIAAAACEKVPANLRTVEQNTVPSWLWRHQSRGTAYACESDLRDLFNRVVGSAAAKAWRQTFFTSEKHARTFYDELRFALVHRHIAFSPEILKPLGLDWAYGIAIPKTIASMLTPLRADAPSSESELSNLEIDAAVNKPADGALWKKLFRPQKSHSANPQAIKLRLRDTSKDWHSSAPNAARAAIDVLALRHNDGSVNVEALKQAARLVTILLDLHDRHDVTVSLVNVAPLLLALGLAYESDAARATAASLAALVTAECTLATAEMAALRGATQAFADAREGVMRSLRNHRRAVYGDGNDYEKLSVLPAALSLKNCPDLALLAEAQRQWDAAVLHAHTFGMRTIQTTDLTPSPTLNILMTSSSQALEPLSRLTLLRQSEDGHFESVLHPAVNEALTRLGYPRNISVALEDHIVGTRSLVKSPSINESSLRAAGLSASAFERVEAYLSQVDNVRLALTAWVVGIEFCATHLQLSKRTLQSPRFDLIKHLGFSEDDVDVANLHCYGAKTLRNAKLLHLRHRSMFACGNEVSNEARVKMAASVQSFISGDTGLSAILPVAHSVERGSELTLAAWKSGLKSLTLIFDASLQAKTVRPASVSAFRKIKASAHSHAKSFSSPAGRQRHGRSDARVTVKSTRTVSKGH